MTQSFPKSQNLILKRCHIHSVFDASILLFLLFFSYDDTKEISVDHGWLNVIKNCYAHYSIHLLCFRKAPNHHSLLQFWVQFQNYSLHLAYNGSHQIVHAGKTVDIFSPHHCLLLANHRRKKPEDILPPPQCCGEVWRIFYKNGKSTEKKVVTRTLGMFFLIAYLFKNLILKIWLRTHYVHSQQIWVLNHFLIETRQAVYWFPVDYIIHWEHSFSHSSG